MCDMLLGLRIPVDAALIKGRCAYLQAHLYAFLTQFGFLMPSCNGWKLSRKLTNYNGHLILLASVI